MQSSRDFSSLQAVSASLAAIRDLSWQTQSDSVSGMANLATNRRVFSNGRPLAGRQKDICIDRKYIHTVRGYDEKNRYVVVAIYTKTPEEVREENIPLRIG